MGSYYTLLLHLWNVQTALPDPIMEEWLVSHGVDELEECLLICIAGDWKARRRQNVKLLDGAFQYYYMHYSLYYTHHLSWLNRIIAAPASVSTSCALLSVLKSHFNLACIGLFKQLLSKSEKRFVRTHWLQGVLGLSEVLWVRTVLFVGKCEFRSRRFKKASRALATRAKARLLDQNRQSPDCTAQRSNHWAKTTNLTFQSVNHCDYKVWLQKRIHNQKNMLNRNLIARQLWCWVPQRRLDLATRMKCVCKVLIYHPPKTQHFIMIWRCCSRPWMLWGSTKAKRLTFRNDWFCHLLV